MSRPGPVSVHRGPKRDGEEKLAALRAQFGPHGVEVVQFERVRRGDWRLRFRLTPEREKIRQINLKLKEASVGFEPSESQRAILAALFAGAELLAFQWAGRPAWRLSSKHTRERAEDVALLAQNRLIRRAKAGDAYKLTPEGSRTVLRRLA